MFLGRIKKPSTIIPISPFQADPKLQPSVRNVGSGLVRAGVAAGTKNAEEFLSLGEFTPATGFGFLRCSGKAKKLIFTCARPTTVFFLTMAPTANVDPAVKKWTSLNDNTGERGVETSAGYYGTIKQKKILKPEEQEIEFETTLEESKSLLFFQPDFHAKSFAATEAQENADMESSAVNVGLVVDARNDKTLDEKVEDLKQRQANGEKLTAKEKKMLERHTAETKYCFISLLFFDGGHRSTMFVGGACAFLRLIHTKASSFAAQMIPSPPIYQISQPGRRCRYWRFESFLYRRTRRAGHPPALRRLRGV